eukprot:GILI01012910.1.p1 GENE.GILI01012910.1~~GILI01012910.1.p1  ORF type:complete len:299 (+),score=70.99 GILI01012910.1:66-962(+)
MATRDRTEDFMRKRPVKATSGGDALMGGTAAISVKPLWVTKMEEVRALQKTIDNKMKELQTVQREKLKIRFASTKNENREDDKLQILTAEITQGFKEAERMLETVKTVFTSEFDDDDGTTTELIILKNVQQCLANGISAQMRQFGDSQGKFHRDIQQQKSIAKKGSDEQRQAIRQELEKEATLERYRMQGMTQEQIEERMFAEKDADERRQDLLAIQTGFMEVSEMIQDLHQLVIEQGSVLDRIDTNMTMAHTRVKKGHEQLKKAQQHQQAGCFKLMVLLIIILIIGFILAIAAKALS